MEFYFIAYFVLALFDIQISAYLLPTGISLVFSFLTALFLFICSLSFLFSQCPLTSHFFPLSLDLFYLFSSSLFPTFPLPVTLFPTFQRIYLLLLFKLVFRKLHTYFYEIHGFVFQSYPHLKINYHRAFILT